jgi:hypothetical protein
VTLCKSFGLLLVLVQTSRVIYYRLHLHLFAFLRGLFMTVIGGRTLPSMQLEAADTGSGLWWSSQMSLGGRFQVIPTMFCGSCIVLLILHCRSRAPETVSSSPLESASFACVLPIGGFMGTMQAAGTIGCMLIDFTSSGVGLKLDRSLVADVDSLRAS